MSIIGDHGKKNYYINIYLNTNIYQWGNNFYLFVYFMIIYNILNGKVEIVPLQASQFVPHCKKCQAVEHTQKVCANMRKMCRQIHEMPETCKPEMGKLCRRTPCKLTGNCCRRKV